MMQQRYLILAPLLLAACGGKEETGPRTPPPVAVRIAAASRMDAPVTIVASGVVNPMETVAVQSQVSGVLQRVAFQEGDYVTKGQILFQVDPRPLQAQLAQAQAALSRSLAQAEAARRSDARYQALVGQDYVAREQADQVRAASLAASATVAADRAALEAAQVNLSYATIRAPLSGRTGGLLTRLGNVVGPGSGPLVIINQLQPVLVRFPVLSQDLPLLQGALSARPLPVTVTLSDSSDIVERGELAFLDNAVDSLTGTLTGKATLQNRANRFFPGQLVFLRVEAGTQPNSLVVPTAAIVTGQQGNFVYVVNPQTKVATQRNIAVGRAVGMVTIVERGLTDGEQVVTDGQSRIKPGSKVAIVTGRPGATGGAVGSSDPTSTFGAYSGSGGGGAGGGAAGVGVGGGVGGAPGVGGAGGAAGGPGGVGSAGTGAAGAGSGAASGGTSGTAGAAAVARGAGGETGGRTGSGAGRGGSSPSGPQGAGAPAARGGAGAVGTGGAVTTGGGRAP